MINWPGRPAERQHGYPFVLIRVIQAVIKSLVIALLTGLLLVVLDREVGQDPVTVVPTVWRGNSRIQAPREVAVPPIYGGYVFPAPAEGSALE